MTRSELETKIEQEAFKFMHMIKESASDTVMMWCQRNKVPVDFALLEKILNQYKASLDSEWMAKADFFLKGLDKDLEEFTTEENPLLRTKKSKNP